MLAPAPANGSNTPSLRSLDPTEGFFARIGGFAQLIARFPDTNAPLTSYLPSPSTKVGGCPTSSSTHRAYNEDAPTKEVH